VPPGGFEASRWVSGEKKDPKKFRAGNDFFFTSDKVTILVGALPFRILSAPRLAFQLIYFPDSPWITAFLPTDTDSFPGGGGGGALLCDVFTLNQAKNGEHTGVNLKVENRTCSG